MRTAKVYLDFEPELRRVIDDSGLSVADVLRDQGVELPIEVSEEELPSAREGERDKDIGIVVNLGPGLVVSIGAAVSMVILALSRFLKERESAPELVTTYRTDKITGTDGKLRTVLIAEQAFKQPHLAETATQIEAVVKPDAELTVKFSTKEGPTP